MIAPVPAEHRPLEPVPKPFNARRTLIDGFALLINCVQDDLDCVGRGRSTSLVPCPSYR